MNGNIEISQRYILEVRRFFSVHINIPVLYVIFFCNQKSHLGHIYFLGKFSNARNLSFVKNVELIFLTARQGPIYRIEQEFTSLCIKEDIRILFPF